jgi:hypothetical protein
MFFHPGSDDGRDESANERMDRNWIELLQELRVTQTGVQVLGGFLLTLAFQARFEVLNEVQRDLYLGLVLLAAGSIIVGLAPVHLHRALFRMRLKPSVVAFGHVALRAQLLSVAVIVVGTVVLVLDVTVGGAGALVAATVLVSGIVAAAVTPGIIRRRHRPPSAAAAEAEELEESARTGGWAVSGSGSGPSRHPGEVDRAGGRGTRIGSRRESPHR